MEIFRNLAPGECFAIHGDCFIKTNQTPEGCERGEGWRESVHLQMGHIVSPPVPPQMEVEPVRIKIVRGRER